MNKREKDARLATETEEEAESESACPAFGIGSLPGMKTKTVMCDTTAKQFSSEATDQECCLAHRATKMYEIALAEKQDFWVLSQKGFSTS